MLTEFIGSTKSGIDPSPQLMLINEMVPSGSEAVKFILTIWPGLVGLGVIPVAVNVGDLSFTFSSVTAEPCPAEFRAVTLILNASEVPAPASVYV